MRKPRPVCRTCGARTHLTVDHYAVDARQAALTEEGRQEMARIAAIAKVTAKFTPGDDGDDRPAPETVDVSEDYPGQRIDGSDEMPEQSTGGADAGPDRRTVYATRLLVDGVRDADRTLKAFQERLQTSPVDAFKWGAEAVKAAAVVEVYGDLLKLLDEKGFEAMLEAAVESALNGAGYPQHSTSALSNLVAEAMVAAYATVARDARRWADRKETV